MTNVYTAAEIEQVYGITLRINEDNPKGFELLQAACRRLNYLYNNIDQWQHEYMDDIITLKTKDQTWAQILLLDSVEAIQNTPPEVIGAALRQYQNYFQQQSKESDFLGKQSPLLDLYKQIINTCKQLGINTDNPPTTCPDLQAYILKPVTSQVAPSNLTLTNGLS